MSHLLSILFIRIYLETVLIFYFNNNIQDTGNIATEMQPQNWLMGYEYI